jgi:hypothetical protein
MAAERGIPDRRTRKAIKARGEVIRAHRQARLIRQQADDAAEALRLRTESSPDTGRATERSIRG